MTENTTERDKDYGSEGNLHYKKALITAEALIKAQQAMGRNLQDLLEHQLDMAKNPKIAFTIPVPKNWIPQNSQEATLEGIEDAFLKVGIKPKKEGQQR